MPGRNRRVTSATRLDNSLPSLRNSVSISFDILLSFCASSSIFCVFVLSSTAARWYAYSLISFRTQVSERSYLPKGSHFEASLQMLVPSVASFPKTMHKIAVDSSLACPQVSLGFRNVQHGLPSSPLKSPRPLWGSHSRGWYAAIFHAYRYSACSSPGGLGQLKSYSNSMSTLWNRVTIRSNYLLDISNGFAKAPQSFIKANHYSVYENIVDRKWALAQWGRVWLGDSICNQLLHPWGY